MTIAAGVFCIDGIAVAADTKESYGDTHTYVEKLLIVSTDLCKGAIVGSGDGYLLDYIAPQIIALASVSSSSVKFEAALSDLMAEIYNSSSVKSYPIESTADLYTQFLVAVKCRDDSEVTLLVINSTLVTRAHNFGTVIGCGPLRQVGEEFGEVAPFAIERAKEAALCIVYEAKRRYSDVGGTTRITTISNDGVLKQYREGIVEKESLLDRVRRMTNLITVSVLDSTFSANHFNTIVKNTGSTLRDYHREAQKIDREAGMVDKKWFKRMARKGHRQFFKKQGAIKKTTTQLT
jgi:hypothetical protein